jgi:hypothetical protein
VPEADPERVRRSSEAAEKVVPQATYDKIKDQIIAKQGPTKK